MGRMEGADGVRKGVRVGDRVDRRGARWIILSDLASGRAARPAAVATRFGWRLLAANNRPLGRAVMLTDSVQECVRQARLVHQAALSTDTLQTTIAPRPGGGKWVWRTTLDGVAVAVSAHQFARRGECARALMQFLAAAANSEPRAGDVRHYGPQALRGYDLPGQQRGGSAEAATDAHVHEVSSGEGR